MAIPEHLRKAMLADYEEQISEVRKALARCDSPCSVRAQNLGQKLTSLVRARNDLRTHQETHQIEQKRGIA